MFSCQNFNNVFEKSRDPIDPFRDPPGGRDPQFEEPCFKG